MQKSKRIIKFETVYDKELENNILLALFENSEELSLLELSRILGKEYNEGSGGWNELKLHLMDMEERGLLEERHFGEDAEDWNKIVDYSLESMGIEKAKKLKGIK